MFVSRLNTFAWFPYFVSEYTWLDEDYLEELQDTGISDLDSNASILVSQQVKKPLYLLIYKEYKNDVIE